MSSGGWCGIGPNTSLLVLIGGRGKTDATLDCRARQRGEPFIPIPHVAGSPGGRVRFHGASRNEWAILGRYLLSADSLSSGFAFLHAAGFEHLGGEIEAEAEIVGEVGEGEVQDQGVGFWHLEEDGGVAREPERGEGE